MPHRLTSVAILVFWAVSAAALLIRDVLPDLLVGPPPNLRDVSAVDTPTGETRWTLLVPDPDGATPDDLRAIGLATTETIPHPADGHVLFRSTVAFDSGAALEGTPLESAGGEHLRIDSTLDVDPAGNLASLRSGVRLDDDPGRDGDELLVVDGHLQGDEIVLSARGPMLPWGPRRFAFPYRARGMVQNTLSPLDRYPGLHLGQRWQSRVVNPLTGRVDAVSVEVTDRNVMIPWGEELVPTYVIVTRTPGPGLTARTWARASDGLVIRQEVPLLIVRLVLERQPDAAPGAFGGPVAPGSPR